jgi:hemoglobin/transferrin/lactoferrin receptor protein
MLVILIAAAYPVAVEAATTAIDEVTVTVKRRLASASDVSSAVTIVDGSIVQAQKLTTDALAANVGTFLQQTTPGQGAAIVRGLYGSSVLHLVDNIRLNNAIFRSAPTQYLALVPTIAIERLEILRGTSASLYGSDAVGGAVEVVTRVPEFDSAGTQYRGNASIGFDTAELAKRANGTLDFGNQDFAASLSGDYQNVGDRRTGRGERIKPSAYESKALRMLLNVTPEAGSSWLLDMHYLEQPETPRVDELVAGFGQEGPSSSEFLFAPNQRIFARASHTNTSGFFGLDWSADLAWQRVVDDRISREFQASERLLESNRSDLYAAIISAAGKTELVDWIIGAEIYHDRVSSSRSAVDINTFQSQERTPRFPDGSTLQQAALYFHIDRHIADRHTLSAGVRFSNVEVELPATSISAATSNRINDTSGDLGWIYQLNDTSSLVANVGYGFRAPNIFDLGTLGSRPGNRFNVPNAGLGSEHVLQGDVGLRMQKENWNAEIVLFAMDYDDRITSAFTGDVTEEGRDIVQSVNAARSTIQGIEARMEFVFSDSLTAAMALNAVRGEQQVTGGQMEPADRMPPVNGKIELGYDAGGEWRIDAWARFAAAQDRLSARDIRDNRINPDGTPGWGVIGIQLIVDAGESWRISLRGDNLLDKRYRMHGSGLDGVGRNLSVTIEKTWL